ncbi:MAG: glycosyltransferase family 39 protein [Candidatus Uhrbacteria bacterium]
MKQKHWLIACVLLFVLFVGLRLPLLSQIYHQDEYKWAQIEDPKYGLQGSIPHPPLVETLYRAWGGVFGYDYLRGLPLLVTCVNILLGMFLVRRWFGEKAALWYGLILTVMTASLQASTQIDIDGAFLPLWSLIAFWGATDIKDPKLRKRGIVILAIAMFGGFITKISYILVPIVLIAEALFDGRLKVKRSYLISAFTFSILAVVLWISPVLNGIGFVTYAKSFGFLNIHRDYFELLLLCLKSTVLLGPVAVVALLSAFKQPKRYMFQILLVVSQLLFYIVIFDFTHRTLERYLLALALPIAMVAGDALSQWMDREAIRSKGGWIGALIVLALFSGLTFVLPKEAIPLHPKEQFVQKVVHMDLGFLIPISGGSGPIGFFVPTDVTIFSFAIVMILCAFLVFKKQDKRLILPLILLLFAFPLLADEEFSFGKLFGNASRLAIDATAWVNNNPDINQVITYNDIGGWELGESKKYYKRFYLNPEFQNSTRKKMTEFDGYYLVVGMPPLPPEDPSMKYFEQCRDVYHQTDQKISADVYDCRGVEY